MRHAVRKLGMQGVQMLTEENSISLVMKDRQWEVREGRFHATALEEVNSQIRNYNNVAPYTVRKGYLELPSELERAYRDARPLIREEVASRRAGRMNELDQKMGSKSGPPDERELGILEPSVSVGLWECLRRWWWSMFSGRG